MAPFKDKREFRAVMNGLFELMSRDPEVGPRLRAADTPQRFVFTDYKLTLTSRASSAKAAAKGDNLEWTWGENDWPVDVTLEMASGVANRYFQGKQNVPIAVLRGQIVIRAGKLLKTLALIPITRPVYAKYVAMLTNTGRGHLVV